MLGFICLRSQRFPLDNRGTNTGFKEFSKYLPRFGDQQKIASWYFSATPAKEEENSPTVATCIANGNEVGSGSGLAALETDEANPHAETNPQAMAMSKKGSDNRPLRSAV